MPGEDKQFLPNEIILQIDFAPNPRIIDNRGEWTKRLVKLFGWKEWLIDPNTCHVFPTEKTAMATVGFRQCRCYKLDCQTRDEFKQLCQLFINSLFSYDDFDNPLAVNRLGVRSQFFGICPAECVLRPLIAWLGSNLGFGSSPEVNDGRSNGAECGEGALLA